MAVRIGIT